MYKFIIDPSTNQAASIFSKKGKNILKKYLMRVLGGSMPTCDIMLNEYDGKKSEVKKTIKGTVAANKTQLNHLAREEALNNYLESFSKAEVKNKLIVCNGRRELIEELNTELSEKMTEPEYKKYTETVRTSKLNVETYKSNLRTFINSLPDDEEDKDEMIKAIDKLAKGNVDLTFAKLFIVRYSDDIEILNKIKNIPSKYMTTT